MIQLSDVIEGYEVALVAQRDAEIVMAQSRKAAAAFDELSAEYMKQEKMPPSKKFDPEQKKYV